MPILTAKERVGTEIGGRYKLERILGEGGFSAVFLAEHTLTGRKVALKILHAHLVQDEQIAQRFLLEAQSMARLKHPGITQVLDAGREPDGTVFLALELLEGETLESMLSRVGRLPRQEATRIALDVLAALTVAHTAGIVHRDIKPANIYLSHEPDGSQHAKVLDFGIAHVAPKGGDKLTSRGVILGTPEYMSPEQGRGMKIGPEADLWSLGIVMYEMFTGVVPWTHESSTVVLMTVASGELPDIREFAPDLPEPYIAIIENALRKDPQTRFPSAAEMRQALVGAVREVEGKSSAEFRVLPISAVKGGVSAVSQAQTPAPVIPSPAVAALPPKSKVADFDLEGSGEPSASLEIDPAAEAMVRASRDPARSASSASLAAVRPAGLSPRVGSNPSMDHPSQSSLSVGDPGARAGADSSGRHAASGRDVAKDGPLPLPASLPPPPVPAAHDDLFGDLPLPPGHDDLPLPPPRVSAPPPSYGPVGSVSPRVSHAPPSFGPVGGSSPRMSHAPSPPPTSVSRAPSTPAPSGQSRSVLTLVVPIALLAAGIGAFALYNLRPAPGSTTTRARPGANHPDAAATEAPTVTERRLLQRVSIALPYGVTPEGAHSFARHAIAGDPGTGGLRTIATCVHENLYVYGAGDGLPTGSASVPIACDMPDLAVVADVDGDGADDIAAVSRAHDSVLVLATHQLAVRASYALPGAQALAGSFVLRGEPMVIAYVEPHGPAGGTELIALSARSGTIVWRVAGRAPLLRLGHPADLGLTVGPDANGDGVPDIAAGATVLPSLPIDQMPARPRCVELISGADGRRIWSEPFCQLRGGSQSVSLGPDVDGDHRADVAVGSDVTRGADPRAAIVSGADGHVIRRVTTPGGARAAGFGWPVALGPDLTGDQVPDLAVGSVGSAGTHVTVVSGANGQSVASADVRGDVGFPSLRLRIAIGLLRGDRASLLVAGPDDGLHVYVLGEASE